LISDPLLQAPIWSTWTPLENDPADDETALLSPNGLEVSNATENTALFTYDGLDDLTIAGSALTTHLYLAVSKATSDQFTGISVWHEGGTSLDDVWAFDESSEPVWVYNNVSLDSDFVAPDYLSVVSDTHPFSLKIYALYLFDLTAIYGAGNEPTSPADYQYFTDNFRNATMGDGIVSNIGTSFAWLVTAFSNGIANASTIFWNNGLTGASVVLLSLFAIGTAIALLWKVFDLVAEFLVRR